ncbi:unnamed protein product, partial [Polarella glacialis]
MTGVQRQTRESKPASNDLTTAQGTVVLSALPCEEEGTVPLPSLTPAPVLPAAAVPAAVAVVVAVPVSVPVLPLGERSAGAGVGAGPSGLSPLSLCLTTLPSASLPPELEAQGFVLDSGTGGGPSPSSSPDGGGSQPLVEPDGSGLIGEGAFAAVRRLRHVASGSYAALKIVERHPLLIRDMLPQLDREVRIQGALRHPSIVALLASFEDECYTYLLLEYCNGGSLRGLLQPRLSEPQAARY